MVGLCLGNASILSYYFQNGGPTLYVNDSSLVTSLSLTSAGRVWQINVAGYSEFVLLDSWSLSTITVIAIIKLGMMHVLI